jgi:hypothetical protein
MRLSTKHVGGISTRCKLGLLMLLSLLSLLLVACASDTSRLNQPLSENRLSLVDNPALDPAAEPVVDKSDPLEVAAVVPDEELQEMRGCYGIYYFTYVMDLNLVDQPSAQVSYAAVVPDGSPATGLEGATAYYGDNNVFFTAGPSSSGLGSTVIVAGHGVTVNTNVQFNFHLPDASQLIPTINVMPQISGTTF